MTRDIVFGFLTTVSIIVGKFYKFSIGSSIRFCH